MDDSYSEFRWYDYLIFTVTLLISLGIGIYYALTGGRQRTTKEYLVANKSMGTFPVALSIYVSHVSAILILGSTAEVYQYGITQWYQALGGVVAHILAALAFVPLFYDIGFTSSFMYLEARFGSKLVKLIGGAFLILHSTVYMGLAMFSPAIALEGVTGIPIWMSILATGVVGGMKAVIGTDTFQGVIMIGGVLLVLILGCIKVGGLGAAWETASEKGRLDVDYAPTPFVRMSFWSAFIGKIFSETGAAGVAQPSVQRIISTPSKIHARNVFLWNIPIVFVMYTMVYLSGVVVFAYYDQLGCDPMRTGQITSSNQLLPYFIMDGLRIPGLPGLFVAVLFCGALSSVSSQLTSLSAVTWKDMLEWKFYYLTEFQKATLNKILSFIYGVIAIIMAFLFAYGQGNVLQMSNTIFGAISGPITGVFICGMFFPCCEWKGVVIGLTTGFLVTVTITIGNSINYPWGETLATDVSQCAAMNLTVIKGMGHNKEGVFPLFTMAFGWYYAIAITITIVVSLLVSLIFFPQEPHKQNPQYFVPFFDRIMCCLPEKWRHRLYCSVPMDDLLEEQEPIKDKDELLNKVDSMSDFENPSRIINKDIATTVVAKEHTYL